MHDEVKVAIRLPDESVIFLTLNSTRDLIPIKPLGFREAGDGMHHHVRVEHLQKDDIYRVGEYALDRAQAEILLSRLFTLLYGVKHGR